MTSRILAGAAALAFALPAFSARAQVAQHPQRDVDVLDYDVHLVLPDTGAFIRGDVTVTAVRAKGASLLRLDLASQLAVHDVTVNGRSVPAEHRGMTLSVPLDGARGDTVRARIVYDGFVTDGLIVQKDAQGRWTWFGDNWPDRARQWLPTVDHPDDKATVSFTVRAPSARTVVANGTLLGVRALDGADAGLSETRWREAHPIPTYLMVIGAAPLVRVPIADSGCVASAVHRCVEQSVYSMPEVRDWLPGPFTAAPAIVSYFESLVGPFPYEKLSHLQSATRFGGMENASAIFYADKLFAERTLKQDIIAHETAHQWFGDAVTEREWHDLWLSEGFATYFDALWTRHSRGEAAYRAQMASIRERVLADTIVRKRPVRDTAQTNYMALLNANSYEKGGYTLYMLHERLGDSAFFGGLRAYYAAHRDGNATTDDLRAALERSSGESLAEFFDQWLRRPYAATPVIGWAWNPADETVGLLVLQEGRSPAYDLPLTVAVRDAEGQVRRVRVHVPAQARVEIPLPGRWQRKPEAVIPDPDRFLLARITSP